MQTNNTPNKARTPIKEADIPREIHCNGQHSSGLKISTGKNSIFIRHQEKHNNTHRSEEKIEARNDTAPSLRSLENIEKGSFPLLSTKSDRGQPNACGNPLHTSETNANNAIQVTSEVHAHAIDRTSSRNTIEYDRNSEFLGKQGSIPSIDTEHPNARDVQNNSGDTGQRIYHQDVSTENLDDSKSEFDVCHDNMSVMSEGISQPNKVIYTTIDKRDDINLCKEDKSETNSSAQEPVLDISAKLMGKNRDSSNNVLVATQEMECTQNKVISDNPEKSEIDHAHILSGSKGTVSANHTSISDNKNTPKDVSIRVLSMAKATASTDDKIIFDNNKNLDNGSAHALSEEKETESLNGSFALADDFSDGNQSSPGPTSVQSRDHHPESSNGSFRLVDDISHGNQSSLGPTSVENHHHHAESSNGSFTAIDDILDGDRSSLGTASVQTHDLHPKEKNRQGQLRSPRSYATSNASSKEDFDLYDTDGGVTESGLSVESPVQPTMSKKRASHYFSSAEDSLNATKSPCGDDSSFLTLGNHCRMSRRVLNPPHPICSLQRLEELILQRKREELKAQRSKKGRQIKRKKLPPRKRRKVKSCRR